MPFRRIETDGFLLIVGQCNERTSLTASWTDHLHAMRFTFSIKDYAVNPIAARIIDEGSANAIDDLAIFLEDNYGAGCPSDLFTKLREISYPEKSGLKWLRSQRSPSIEAQRIIDRAKELAENMTTDEAEKGMADAMGVESGALSDWDE